MLAWGMLEHQDGYAKAGEWANALDCLKWATDYMIKVLFSLDVSEVEGDSN